MATAIITLHQVWDCRWSEQATSAAGALQAEGGWVCVHDGHRRAIGEAECRTCSFWELRPQAMAASLAEHAGAASEIISSNILEFSTRAVMLLTAVFFAAIGFATLTGPMSIPLTVTLWLCAAACAGLAAFWQPSEG